MTSFDHILNWNLKKGSHEFPGPDGGTCINEAAIVAAGFPYRRVTTSLNMPSCFSGVISEFALMLNDRMPDRQRQRLLPFVVRLAGTADTAEVERRRGEFLAMQAVTVFAARALEAAGFLDEAALCRSATTFEEAKSFSHAAVASTWRPTTAVAVVPLRLAAGRAARSAALPTRSHMAARIAADTAAEAAATEVAAAVAATSAAIAAGVIRSARITEDLMNVARTAADTTAVWDDAIATLEGVLAIGKQADALDIASVSHRLERAKERVA